MTLSGNELAKTYNSVIEKKLMDGPIVLDRGSNLRFSVEELKFSEGQFYAKGKDGKKQGIGIYFDSKNKEITLNSSEISDLAYRMRNKLNAVIIRHPKKIDSEMHSTYKQLSRNEFKYQ